VTEIKVSSKHSEVKPRGYYVYIHRRMTDMGIFYVGKGKDDRAWVIKGRKNEHWERNAKKHGVHIEIVAHGLLEHEALRLEVETIASIGKSNLANATNGGDGVSGMTHSEMARSKMSASRKGRKHSPDHIAKCAASNSGKTRSDDQKLRMSIAKGGDKEYTFIHDDHGRITCSVYVLSTLYDVMRSKIYLVSIGDRKTHNGWRLA